MYPEKDKNGLSSKSSPIADQTHQVIDEAKELGNKIYSEGKDRLDELQSNLKVHSDKVVQKVHEKPLHSLLIAAGVGFILGHLFRK